jgi:uncharacterized membrane protein
MSPRSHRATPIRRRDIKYWMVQPNLGSLEKTRVTSVDALRGLVMIIMALDHTREFFHSGAMSFSPEDLARTTPVLFFTRWITHICAPVFMFTAGLAAFFWLRPGRTTNQLAQFLWKRGFWLVVLELTALRFATNLVFVHGIVFLSILWALGWSMVALGFLVRLPTPALAVFSVSVIALHNLADSIRASQFGAAAWIWNVVHQPGLFSVDGANVLAAYPLVPWIAVMAAGYCFGPILKLDRSQRQRWMVRIGLSLTLGFVALRWINVYGDPSRWSAQVPGMTVISFLRCTKYPPSLDFLLMTLGPALLLLAWLDRLVLARTNPLIVFGRVPLFYFLVHFYVLHVLCFPFAFIRYGHAAFLVNPAPSMGGAANLYPPDYGYPLWVVYAVWISVVALLYPLCLWFRRLKERRSDWWLSYV